MSKWDGMFTEDHLPELFKNVEQAKRLGKEGFATALTDVAEQAMEAPGLPDLLTGLVIGEIAFGAYPGIEVALTDKHKVSIRIEEL